MNKIIYITTTRFPTEKAHGLATIKICEAFGESGYEVDIIAPKLWRRTEGDVFNYYDVKKNLRLFKIPCIDLIPLRVLDKFAFILQTASFMLLSLPYIFLKYGKDIKQYIFFSHDYIPLYFMTFLPVNIFYDIHHFPGQNFMYRRVMKKSFGFAVQTKWKIKELEDKFGVPVDKIVYWPNGTDVERFNIPQSVTEARKILGLPTDKKIVMYTGQLFNWKGVDSLIKAVCYLSPEVLIYIIGGSDQDVVNCKKEITEANDSRIIFIPFVRHSQIPLWLRAADVLVLPNTGKQKVSLYYTSPMKLFEYMAANKPIVSSAIPSIMEILNNNNAVLVEPDNEEAFGSGINKVLSNPILASNLSFESLEDSHKYTWRNRAQKIIDYFSNHA